ncbi:hypothetical protein NVP1209O_62 [Vibrio phage 1.209.O._10N.222.52.B2]|nr:hypothetical protein NVP1209O_62 [Vibrio phage 1.209.O._10N.222.52.B2]
MYWYDVCNDYSIAEREKFIDWTCNLIEEWGYHYE